MRPQLQSFVYLRLSPTPKEPPKIWNIHNHWLKFDTHSRPRGEQRRSAPAPRGCGCVDVEVTEDGPAGTSAEEFGRSRDVRFTQFHIHTYTFTP